MKSPQVSLILFLARRGGTIEGVILYIDGNVKSDYYCMISITNKFLNLLSKSVLYQTSASFFSLFIIAATTT